MFNRLRFADDLELIASSEQVLQHALVWDAVRKKIISDRFNTKTAKSDRFTEYVPI